MKKKLSPAKKRIIENYERQRTEFIERGYQEKSEVISIVQANVMVLAAALPLIIIGRFIWGIFNRGDWWIGGWNVPLLWFLVIFSMAIHEVLHGAGWCMGAKEKWKSMYIGVMWESLTPYCHCKEPLQPGRYLIGSLLPGVILGAGIYIASIITGNAMLLWLGMINILGAGGDIWIAWRVRKYRTGYVLDHPTECGFLIFQKQD